MSETTYDVAVVGAGPAGATAATLLAARGRRVVLVDRVRLPRPAAGLAWVSAQVPPVLQELGVPTAGLLDQPFEQVTFYNGDLSKSATPAFETQPGHLVERAAFANALAGAAEQAGVAMMLGERVSGLKVLENSVTLETVKGSERSAHSARLLLLACGSDGELPRALGFPRQTGPVLATVQVDAALPDQARQQPPRIAIIFGLDRRGSFGLCCSTNDRVMISVNWVAEPTDAQPALVQLCQLLHANHHVPIDLSAAAQQAPTRSSPAAVALDLDSHVGKHTLLIGDAGGFVAGGSNEGIYPAMWSAQLASEVVDAALDSERSQDELMQFEQRWRMTMADYLRPPNTDMQFLLPLIFSNQPMADRMGAAFFFGENI